MPRKHTLTSGAVALIALLASTLDAHEGHDVNLDPGPDGAGGIFDASNVVLIGRLGLGDFNGIGLTSGADCWGYTSPGGREYAIMTADAMVAFVEITDPAEPVIVGTIAHGSNLWCDVKVVNEHAYVSTELSGGSIQIIDLTAIDTGVVSLVGSISDIGVTRAHNVIVDNLGQRLYLCGARNGVSSVGGGGLVAFDVSDPANPVYLGAYNSNYVHDAQVHVFDSGPYAGKTIAFCFAAELGIDIVDFTNAAAPVRLSRTTYAGLAYCHQGWYDPTTNMLYQNDELDEYDGFVSVTTTRVFDCTDLSNPQFMGVYSTGLPSIDHNLYVRDGFVYHANYRSGLRIFDATTNAISPTEAGYLDTYPANDNVDFSGAWSVYPYFDSGVVIVSDINRGMFIVDPTYALNGGVPFEYEYTDPIPEVIPETGMTFTFKINDTNGAVDPDNVWFSYANTTNPPAPAPRHGGHPHTVEQAIPLGGGLFQATFPPAACGDSLEYYFVAYTAEGMPVISPFASPIVGAPSAAFSAVYASGLSAAIEDDFETDQGWSPSLPTDTATTGDWVRVDPIGTANAGGIVAQPENDATPGAGTMCFITGQQPVGDTGVGTNDIDNGYTTLLSPTIDASTPGDAILQFNLWYSNDTGAATDDSMTVEISNDDGQSWTVLETVTASTSGWEPRSYDVSSILPTTSTMRIRFIASDEGSPSIVEAGVDDVLMRTIVCAPGLAADLNGDGIVDTADLGILLGVFGTSDPLSDLNGDGTVDTADLGILLSDFGATV
ncbi:MAG: choice-of-anchor B family protein [Phycisphaeraceae bacterium]|nr:choice-of-anchor B family protein [Phycisphaeraceae bacterium]